MVGKEMSRKIYRWTFFLRITQVQGEKVSRQIDRRKEKPIIEPSDR